MRGAGRDPRRCRTGLRRAGPRGPNLVAPLPFPGFVAYAPSLVELTLGGRTDTVQPFGAASPPGVSVAIFDAGTPFDPGRYGVGLIQDPPADGAGFVADHRGASPAFALAAGGVVPTTFTGYAGVGVSSGICLIGSPPSCPTAVTPVPMTWAGEAFALQLGDYEEDGSPDGLPFTATISAVPEPGSRLPGARGRRTRGRRGRRPAPVPPRRPATRALNGAPGGPRADGRVSRAPCAPRRPIGSGPAIPRPGV